MQDENLGPSPEEMGLGPEDQNNEGSQNLESSRESIDKLRGELKDIFDPDFSMLGHGAWVENAKETFTNGLLLKQPDLQTTTYALFENSKSFPEQPDEYFDRILNWPHERLPAIVVLMIPNKPTDVKVGISSYVNSTIQELPPEESDEYGVKYIVPKEYVRGYIDVEARKFVENPSFKPTVPDARPEYPQGLPDMDSGVRDLPELPKSNESD
jgi:hypothetical protein